MQRNLVSSCICFRGGSRKTWKVKNVKWQKAWVRGKQLFSFCFFYPSIFTCQNLDQSWSRSLLVGGNRELWQTVTHKEEKQPNFCMYMISSAIWDKSALFNFSKTTNCTRFLSLGKIYLRWFIPNCTRNYVRDYLYKLLPDVRKAILLLGCTLCHQNSNTELSVVLKILLLWGMRAA